jgi:hypothetical protein
LQISIESTFSKPLLAILENITKDKKSAAKKFKQELKEKMNNQTILKMSGIGI